MSKKEDDKKSVKSEEEEEEEVEEEEEEEEEEAIIDLDDQIEDSPQKQEKDPEIEEKVPELDLRNNNENNENQVIEKQFETVNSQNFGAMSLSNVDLNSMPKEEVLNLLLNSNELFNSSSTNLIFDPKASRLTKNPKKNKNFKNTQGTINKEKIKPTYELNEDDPEFTHDLKAAINKIAKKAGIKGGDEKQLSKLLLDKKKLAQMDIYESVNNQTIQAKVEEYLKRKSKKIEGLSEKQNENFIANHTFCPKTNITDKSKLGNLEEFLNSQNNHLKKVVETVKMMKEENQKKESESANHNPQIDYKSTKIFEQKIKNDDKVYDRLYKQRYKKKNTALSIEPKKSELKKCFETKEEIVNNLYANQVSKKTEKLTDLKAKVEKERKSEVVKSLNSSNKILLEKFNSQFDLSFDKSLDSVDQNGYFQILEKLKFSTLKDDINNPNSQNENLLLKINETKLVSTEKKLIQDSFDLLKDEQGKIKRDSLYLFSLCVVNLYEYYLIRKNKNLLGEKNFSDALKTSTDKYLIEKSKAYSELIQKVDKQINESVKNNKKYIGFDENENLVITVSMASLIHKDYTIFNINYFKSTTPNQNNIKPAGLPKSMTFKPNTNEKSNKLSVNFRKKIQNEIYGTANNHNHERSNSQNNQTDEKFNMNYVDMLLIKKNRKEKITASKKAEMENKQIAECTFHPKVNVEYSFSNNTTLENQNPRSERFEILYKTGKNNNLNRKDKTKEEIDIEKNSKECKFYPEINKYDIDHTNSNINYDDESHRKHFERLQNGRMERKIKEVCNSREPFESIKEYENSISKKLNNKSSPVKSPEKKNTKKNDKNHYDNLDIEECTDEQKTKKKEGKEENKELIPLLIIDVNLRPGEKKKIYVFDGDTAEGLSEKFSREHNLDEETKNKLKILIQNHMSKLLLRIDEENQSINSSQ